MGCGRTPSQQQSRGKHGNDHGGGRDNPRVVGIDADTCALGVYGEGFVRSVDPRPDEADA